MQELTKRQQQVLRFIGDFTSEHGFAPTVREIAQAMKIAIKGAQDHLSALQRKGYIERRSRTPRTIQITGGVSAGRIPILGRIAAGRPIDAIENMDGTVPMPADYFGRGELFALEVKGESMRDEHIVDGDLAIIKKQPTVHNGEIAAVAVENDVTLKRFYLRGEKAELRPCNPSFKTQVVPAADVTIVGKFVGLVRR
jgi:repressor LexA